jgi:hypothetical protein
MATFLADPIAQQYYKDAVVQSNLEPPSRNFWSYMIQNHGYPENCFWMTSEHATAGKSGHITQLRRKIDQILNYKEGDGNGGVNCARVLIVIQAKKPAATDDDIDLCEEQTFDAARAATECGIPFVYTLTTIGVTYIFRQYKAGLPRFSPIFKEDEAASTSPVDRDLYSDPFRDPQRWLRYVQATKDGPPSEIYGLGGKQAGIYTMTSTSASASQHHPPPAQQVYSK